MTITYDELSQLVCVNKVYKTTINGIEVQGTFDPVTKILVWQGLFAVRDEEWVRSIIDGTSPLV
jgi:hypothetical protein